MFFLRTKPWFSVIFLKRLNLKYLSQKSAAIKLNNTDYEKSEPERVHEVYADLSQYYDRMLDLSSLGQHNYWKWQLVKMIKPKEELRLLDAAGGQGAISIRCLKSIEEENIKDFELTVCDINSAMMAQGKKKLISLGSNPNAIKWIKGDVHKLPFPNESFNVYAIAFGFRGINIERTFEEAYRVLQPGSFVYCIELHKADNFIIASLFWLCFKYVTPAIGLVMFRTYKPFAYFVEFFLKLPSKKKLKTIIENAGFTNVSYKSLSFGVCAIHWGYKP